MSSCPPLAVVRVCRFASGGNDYFCPLTQKHDFVEHVPAGVPEELLIDVGTNITTLPEGFTPHRQIKKVYAARKEMVASPEGMLDWAMAEALAFGTLVAEGNHVRLSGQVRARCLRCRHARLGDG